MMPSDSSKGRVFFTADEEDFMWKLVIDSLKDADSIPQPIVPPSPLRHTFWHLAKEKYANMWRRTGTYTQRFKRMWQRQEVDRLPPESLAFLHEKLGPPETAEKPLHAASESVPQPSSDAALSLLTGIPIFEALTVREKRDGDKDKTMQQQTRDALIQERNIMADIQHINSVKFFGLCADRLPVKVVMELWPGGSLLEHSLQMTSQISAGERIHYCLETSEGLSYSQDKAYSHRDLAARNCLISKYEIIKIAHFSLSKISSAIKGNVQGHSPQIPLLKSDACAFGVLALEVFSNGKKPWDGWENKRNELLRTSKTLRRNVKRCDPVKRCDFKYLSKKLTELQGNHLALRPSDSTIASIPNVNPLAKDEFQVLKETEDECQQERDYEKKLVSMERQHLFDQFVSLTLTKAEFTAKPMVMFLDQVPFDGSIVRMSASKKEFPEPTSSKFAEVLQMRYETKIEPASLRAFCLTGADEG
ncbi:hypothetical protein QR680_002952 [Steinernema hermaphroditum]|uniref:Protein kinase domain-containing protein n=1 Tax=Steinernema hermaphroditum TaxID=289476 RepID=A0AA39H4U2_9BILA|nr:hypothetical protein QR680_002952 [Steinernema hermaphroditum]